MTSTLIYLHGFLSSPLSAKATLTRDWLTASCLPITFEVPALGDLPEQALTAAETVVITALQRGPVGLIGSSMGGYFATLLAERFGLRAVLVNPAVRPHRRMDRYFGSNTNPYTGAQFVLDVAHARWLAQQLPVAIDPTLYWLLTQQADEVLDYREAVEFYAGCRQTVEPGGNHQFVGFERHLPAIVDFLLLDRR